MTSVLVCGHVTLDATPSGTLPGGSAWYAARTLAALGARPLLLTSAGPDFPREALAGIEALVLEAPSSTAFENRYGPDGARAQRVLRAAPPIDARRVPPAWRSPDALLLAPVAGEIDPRAFLAATRPGISGLCVQGLVREIAPSGEVHPRPFDPAAAGLGALGVAVVGEDEARGDPELVRRLAEIVPVVAFTRGARGSEVFARGRRLARLGVHPAEEVDPTGAGDAFAAAFLLTLARGSDPVEAARLGAAAGSIAVEGRGGEALPRAAEAVERAARVPVVR